jgi:protein TonB
MQEMILCGYMTRKERSSIMTPEKVPVQALEDSRRRITSRDTCRPLMAAAGLSLLVHLLAMGVVVLLSPVVPMESPFDNPGAVELLMEEGKGAVPLQPGQTDTATPPAAEPQAGAPLVVLPEKAETAPTEQPAPTMPSQDPAAESVPASPSSPGQAATGTESEPHPAEHAPDAQKPAAAPIFNFAGTDSDTTATVLPSNGILPAMPDDRFRNRPPAYPPDAARRGETGAVLVIIHIAPNGYATGAEVAESSGSASLDKAAVTAVRKWRFRPAMKGGLAVPFDMTFRFIFSDN